MKPHLPLSLLHAVMCAVCSFTFATATLAGGVMALTAPYAQAASFNESNHHVEATSALSGGVVNSTTTSPLALEGFTSVQMKNNQIVSSFEVRGGVVYHVGKSSSVVLTLPVKDNGNASFSDNSTVSKRSVYGGVIYCSGYAVLDFSDNGDIQFANNSIEGEGTCVEGGVLYCSERNNVYFINNGSVSFSNNHVIGHADAEHTEGGALYLVRHLTDAEKFLISGNKSVTFSDNSAEGQANDVFGGAISSSKILEMSGNNGDMTFRNNSATNTGELIDATAYGGAVYVTAAMKLEHNKGNICVERNNATANSFAAGGAFYLIGSSPFECSENVSVTFSDNSVRAGKTAKGGAICSDININFSGNTGAITFNSNEVISTTQDAEGGAICMASRNAVATFLLSSDLSFASNKATAETQSAKGGAICAARDYGKVLIGGDGDVSFKNNVATGLKSYGGAVYMELNAEFDIAVNGEALFAENAVNSVSFALGGAIHTQSDLSLIADTIGFKDNSVSSMSGPAKGGALYAQGRKIGMQSVHDIVFSGNTVSAGAGNEALGGALWASSQQTTILSAGDNIAFLDNHVIGGKTAQGGALHLNAESAISAGNKMTFAGNTAESCETGTAWGGAICLPNPTEIYRLGLSNTLEFKNNAALAEAGDAYGGAVAVDSSSSSGSLEIKGNIAVSFIGNHADSAGGSAYGGAIYAKKRVEIVDNGNVSFRKNYEKQGTAYKLSDIYSVVAPMLSAAEGGEIRFNGAVVVSDSVVLNQDYTGADAQTHQATGSIVFSGKYTEADLKEIKGGIAGTAEEILNSRASSINGILTLNNGRLLVEDHALLTATRMTAKAGTTVAIDNASLVSSSTSTSASTNTLTDCALVLTNGGALTFGGGLTLSGKVTLDVSGYAAGTYTLLSAYSVKGADLLDISYNAGKNDIYDIAWNEKQNALLLTVTKLGRTEPETHIWSEPSGVLGNDLPLGESGEDFLPGDSLQFNTATTVDIRGEVKPADIVVKNTSGTVELSTTENGSISGSTSLSKSGAGSLTVNTANTYSGGTAISGGTVTAGNAAAFGSGEITLTGGTLAMGTQAVANDVTATGGTLTGTAYEGDLTVKGNVTIGSGFKAGSLDLESGTLKGSVKTGDVHTLYADGGQISGSLTLNGGSIVFGDNPLAVSGALTISSSTALDLSSYSGAGQYTLISAGSVSGNLSNLSYDSTVGRNSYSVIKSGNALVLNVESHAVTLTWDAPKGVWTTGGSFGSGVFESGDDVIFRTAAAVTITGAVEPGEMLVDSAAAVKFTADAKTPGSGIVGKGTLTKSGAGMLTLNAGNRYSGGTVLNAGTIKAAAADSFGTGAITVNGGTLDLASKAVANDIELAGEITLKGDAKYVGSLSVDGNATLLAKTANKSLITIGSGNTLNLAPAATVAGSLDVGGTLNITAAKGLTVTKGNTLTLNGGTVNGLVNVAAGAALALNGGTLTTAPVMTGGKLVMPDAEGDILLSGTGTLALGTQSVGLKGKGELVTDAPFTVTGGKVTLTALNGYDNALEVSGGTLALGKVAVAADVNVSGSAALNNGTAHSGDVNVNGELIKGSVIKLTHFGQNVNLNQNGVMNGTISGMGMVNVNADVDASLGKMTNAYICLNSGTLTNNKGLKLAKNQMLLFNGGHLNLEGKALTTAAGTSLNVMDLATLSGALTLAGGLLVLDDGTDLSVSGALTLSKSTTLIVDGTATLTFGTLTAPKKGTLEEFFGVSEGITISRDGNTLTFSGYSVAATAAPAAAEPEMVAAPAPALAPAVAELAERAAAARPLGDALVMADWGIVDTNRAFTTTLQSRRDSGVLLADGQGMAWVSAMGGVSRHGSENGHNGADVNLNGAAVGVEHTAGANSVLGLAVGHTWSRIGATGMQHLRQDTAHVALYGQTKLPHGFTAEWSAAYGDTDSKGSFYGTRETWSQKSTALSARLNKTHDLNDRTAVRGFAGINYDATDAASIHGMHTGSIQRLQGEVGAGITHRADKLTTYAEASVTTDLARNAPAVDFGTWRQNGATPGRTGLNLTLGAAYELTDKWSINASYHVEAAERATQHSFNVGAGMKF